MYFENLSESEIKNLEAQVAEKRRETTPSFQHYGSVENLSESEIKNLEAQVAEKRRETIPSFQHYGSVENLSDNEIKILEAQVAEKRRETTPSFQHYGSVENLSDNEIKILEAQVAEKRQIDIPFKEYFENLVATANITDTVQFENAVSRSMESNGLMNEFARELVNEISNEAWAFRSTNKEDKETIQKRKQRIEGLVDVYVKCLYALKNNGWTFYGPGNNIGLEMLDEETINDMYKAQRDFEMTFTMPIPSDLGEYYGKAFERQGKMIPGFTLMYDDLKNKEVNWHQVMIYRENELTPRERYLQRQEEAKKQFEMARQEEIKKTLEDAKKQTLQNGAQAPALEQETISIRR